jgi:hypothetical protein
VAIRLRDANGQVVEQIANQVGTFTGSKGVSVTPGIYFLELYGNGNWSVNVESRAAGSSPGGGRGAVWCVSAALLRVHGESPTPRPPLHRNGEGEPRRHYGVVKLGEGRGVARWIAPRLPCSPTMPAGPTQLGHPESQVQR